MSKSSIPADARHLTFMQHQTEPGQIFPTACCAGQILSMERKLTLLVIQAIINSIYYSVLLNQLPY